jgi:hypothetical protein|tara:strand:- start:13292 stop:13717 length:426 start_codon:yes stop_codon:yes gene_type:complete
MANLTITITEAVTLNGASRGSTNTHVESVTQIDHRIVSCLHSAEQTVVLFDTAVAAGTMADATLDYLRLTNLNGTNFVTVRVSGNGEEYFVKLEAGDSFLLNNSVMDANAAGSASVSLANIDSIGIQADTATCDVEVFAAA